MNAHQPVVQIIVKLAILHFIAANDAKLSFVSKERTCIQRFYA